MVAMRERARAIIHKHHHRLPYAAWVVALISLLGSLGFSEVLHLAPCVLCWWQRIFMYPMVVIAGVGILRRDEGWAHYVFPLAVVGTVVALYHSLLQWGILPEAVAPCVAGVSCVTKQINWLGFITIPFMSMLAFGAISIVTAAYIWVRPRVV
jgi:disulfide bond formation protein DsbB